MFQPSSRLRSVGKDTEVSDQRCIPSRCLCHLPDMASLRQLHFLLTTGLENFHVLRWDMNADPQDLFSPTFS